MNTSLGSIVYSDKQYDSGRAIMEANRQLLINTVNIYCDGFLVWRKEEIPLVDRAAGSDGVIRVLVRG
ncbi:MAG: hypothetical protein ACLTZT_18495 [Butyricimonas faecalis]